MHLNQRDEEIDGSIWPCLGKSVMQKSFYLSNWKMARIFSLDTVAEQEEKPIFLLDTLYCSEEQWGTEVREDWFQLDSEANCGFHEYEKINSTEVDFLEEDQTWEEGELTSLLGKEEQNDLYKAIETNPIFAQARREAVDWILKVNAHFSFSALTAVLAVNYLDRFLELKFHLQEGNLWMSQLTAVACLSLAAKVEETQVPLLLDLQVEESRYVFEAKTIKRMEIRVLSTLGWKMNPVTPLSFVDYFSRRLGLRNYLRREFIRRSESITIAMISDSRFLLYHPSILATSTMLHVFKSVEPLIDAECQNQLWWGVIGMDKDKVDECCRLIFSMEKIGGWRSNQSYKRRFGSIPGSPNSIMDVSLSGDSSNDSWGVASASVSSSPEPLPKKYRAHQDLHLLNDTTRIFSQPFNSTFF